MYFPGFKTSSGICVSAIEALVRVSGRISGL